MGFIKQMKDMKSMVHDAPDQIAMAQEMGANAKAMAATQQAQAAAQMAAVTNATAPEATGADLAPIANVSLELYAQISKSLAAANYDQSQAPSLAADRGISGDDWAAAVAGWNARMQSNPAVGKAFSSLYAAS
jgi:hypothetical protein